MSIDTAQVNLPDPVQLQFTMQNSTTPRRMAVMTATLPISSLSLASSNFTKLRRVFMILSILEFFLVVRNTQAYCIIEINVVIVS